ncbi:DUF368 domain-containing protein [Streptomyces sp. SID6673]|nr:DUF368 domain-containing protein [Streptomyces sp. SID11726]NEB27184.1 DUF368 domain-containing protein [Streptomyces sp. SID6673]
MSTNPTTAETHLSPSPGPDNPTDRPDRPRAIAANVIRGALIGVAETVPGVSGGTVALVSGIYGRLIASVKHVLDIPRLLVTRGDWRTSTRQVDWWLLLPVCLGMAVTVFFIAGVMESFVTDQPVASKALFMGMIAMSVIIPFLEIDNGALTTRPARFRAVGVFAIAAAAAFALTSLPRSELVDPPLILTFGAAAIAVCALVLPGVSGSFFLLVVGMYAPTLAAVDTMDIQYLAVFALGALVGLMSFVRALEWLLENHHTLAMVAAAGLLSGSLRALWPWQTDDGGLLGVGGDWPMALLLFAVGAAVVGVVALVQRRLYIADASAVDVEHRDARYSGAP